MCFFQDISEFKRSEQLTMWHFIINVSLTATDKMKRKLITMDKPLVRFSLKGYR